MCCETKSSTNDSISPILWTYGVRPLPSPKASSRPNDCHPFRLIRTEKCSSKINASKQKSWPSNMLARSICNARTPSMAIVASSISPDRNANLVLAQCMRARRKRRRWCEAFWEGWDNNVLSARFITNVRKVTRSGDWERISWSPTGKSDASSYYHRPHLD